MVQILPKLICPVRFASLHAGRFFICVIRLVTAALENNHLDHNLS
jgi:hypothetical protein